MRSGSGNRLAISQLILATMLASSGLAQTYPTADGRTLLADDTTDSRRHLITARDLGRLAALTGITAGVALTLDRGVAVQERDHPAGFYRTLDNMVLDHRLPWSTSPYVFAMPSLLYTVGRFTDEPDVADVGIHATESVALAMALTGGLKIAVGRAQPVSVGDTANMDFRAGGGLGAFARQSFPSGHSAIAFSLAASTTAEVRRRWPHATPLVAGLTYGSATAVAVSRLHDNHHWLSDIVFGAGLGTISGLKVVEFAHAHPRNPIDRVLLASRVMPNLQGGATLAFVVE